MLLFQCDLVYTFFHPLPRDETPGTATSKPAGKAWILVLLSDAQNLFHRPALAPVTEELLTLSELERDRQHPEEHPGEHPEETVGSGSRETLSGRAGSSLGQFSWELRSIWLEFLWLPGHQHSITTFPW